MKTEPNDIDKQLVQGLKGVLFVTLFFGAFCCVLWVIMVLVRVFIGLSPR